MTAKKDPIDFDTLEPLQMEEPVEFTLTDKDLPKSQRGNKGGSKYSGLVTEFLAQEKPTKYIQFSGRKSASVYVGLKKAIAADSLDDKVSVASRGEELWLVKK